MTARPVHLSVVLTFWPVSAVGIREVQALAGRGIAERLVVSPHTVHRHMANIRIKLGAESKAAAVAHLAAWQ